LFCTQKWLAKAVNLLLLGMVMLKCTFRITVHLSFFLFACSTMYWDDRYGTETVSHEVLGRMKQLMVDNNTAASHSFLLDDDSSIPFSLDDISNLMEDKVNQSLAVLNVTVIQYVFFSLTIIHCIRPEASL
jgi:hypothetical protein